MEILSDLAAIIEDLHLPVVVAVYVKELFGKDVIRNDVPASRRAELMHSLAVMDCAVLSQRWLETYTADENAVLVAEDADRVKRMIKRLLLVLRDPERIKEAGLEPWAKDFNLPLTRIIDTCHFASKEDCAPLQLADLCAFSLGRAAKGKSMPDDVMRTIDRHIGWIVNPPRGVASQQTA